MDVNNQRQIKSFFDSIESWRCGYVRTRLHFIARRNGAELIVINARIYLDAIDSEIAEKIFRISDLEARRCDIPSSVSVEEIFFALVGDEGFLLSDGVRLRIATEPNNPPFVSPPINFHPDGLVDGNRVGVLTATGSSWVPLVAQPQTDWALRAAHQPFDSMQELYTAFGLGSLIGDRSLVEVVARSVIEVSAKSAVNNTTARVGVWMAKSLDRTMARIGYRVLSKGDVVIRASTDGANLIWTTGDAGDEGFVILDVPKGSIIQCFASYAGHTHHVQWRVDPSSFQNPRVAVLSMADSQKSFRGFLQPDVGARGRAADDFEEAVAWLMWSLGFSTVSFGANPKTKDACDIVAVSPRGDFMVVECTVGLLRAESKLSKLVARAAALREALDASNMQGFKVLPVIVSSLTIEQLKADVGAADESSVCVISREGIDELVNNQQYRFPDADILFDRAWQSVQDRAMARQVRPTANQYIS